MHQQQLEIPVTMQSPAQSPLNLVLIKTNEAIGRRGVSTYETTLSFKQLAAHFQVEANVDVLGEELKRQRDVEDSRILALKRYWLKSEGAVFPSMTIFVNTLTIGATHEIGDRVLVEAVLEMDSDRFIADGQGRTTFIQYLLANMSGCDDFTIATKVIVTHTESLSVEPAATIIRQLFSDYHINLKRPNRSISKCFDKSSPLARLCLELLEVQVGASATPLKKRIALHGKIRLGHIWTYDQFTGLISKFLGVAPSVANKQLADDAVYQQSLALCSAFLNQVGQILPFEMLDTPNFLEVHEQMMFTKAIFATAIAYVGKSVVEEMLVDDSRNWSALRSLSLPICSKDDKLWQTHNVTMVDDGKVKIIKATDRRIGSLICRELRIFPCHELSA